MEDGNKEKRLLNAGLYLRNAILELKAIACECTEDDYCDRCCLVDDAKSMKNDIDKELNKLLKEE